jgi:hypothetical protein
MIRFSEFLFISLLISASALQAEDDFTPRDKRPPIKREGELPEALKKRVLTPGRIYNPEPPPAPIECYDLYLFTGMTGWEYKERFCSSTAKGQCQSARDKWHNRSKCDFVSKGQQPRPQPRPPVSRDRYECYTLTFTPGPGLLTSEWGNYCSVNANNACNDEADRRNKETPAGRYSCVYKR